MAKKKIFRLIQAGLAAFAIAMALPSCTDDHFDVKEGDGMDANATQTIWEQIEARRGKDLSRFATIVEQTPYFKDEAHKAFKDDAKTQPYTFKDVLSGTQILTVFAPTDDAFTEEEYQDYLTKLKGSMEDQYDVFLRLVGNHITRNRYTATGTGEEKLVMINGKKATFSRSAKKFKDLNLLNSNDASKSGIDYNIPAVNGTLHLIPQQSPFAYNIYEYIKSHGDQFGLLKEWITSFDTIYFSEALSVENGSDANGNPIYVDSVYMRTNTLFRYIDYSENGEDWVMRVKSFHGDLEEEDSVWALAAPTDLAWNNALQENAPYYKYATLYVNKAYEDEGNVDRTIPKDGPMDADSLKELAMRMDLASTLLFNVRQQPRTLTHLGFWSAEEFKTTAMPKIFNTRLDTFFVKEPLTDVKPFILGSAEPVQISNGLLYPIDSWNFFKGEKAKDVEVKVSYQTIFKRENMKGSTEYNTFNNETSKLVNDSLLGSVSKDYFITFSNGSAAPEVNFKLIDQENNHQVMSGVEYEIGVVLVPDFYRWSPDSIMASTSTEIPVKKNKLQIRITYNDGTLTSKGKVSEKQTEKFAFEYEGQRVDTVWLKKSNEELITVTFPVSYKNITDSYPTMSLTSTANRNETAAGKEYQHAFSLDRIILRAKE